MNGLFPTIFHGERSELREKYGLEFLMTSNLNSAFAGLKMAHLTKITLSFEFSVLTLTVPGLRLRKVHNTSCF